jgi:thioredoxin 2
MSISRNIVCSHCSQTNRVPDDHPAAQDLCSACGEALFEGRPAEVTEAEFKRQVAESDIPILVDLWAPWCAPCRTMSPMFEHAASKLEPDVRLLKLNVDAAPQASAQYRIRSIPTLLLIGKGELIGQMSGVMDSERIAQWARNQLFPMEARRPARALS